STQRSGSDRGAAVGGLAALASEGWLEVAGLSVSTVQRVSGPGWPKLNYSVVHLLSVALARQTLQRKCRGRENGSRHASARPNTTKRALSFIRSCRGNSCKDPLTVPTNQGMQLSNFKPTTR